MPPVTQSAVTPDDRFFNTPGPQSGLKQKSVRGGVTTVGSQAAKFVLRFGATAVLARLLTPEDYGLIAMTVVVTGFAGIFKDAGLTAATVQSERLRHAQVSTLFWINVALGCAIAALLAAASPLVAAFYDEPRLAPVTMALGLAFVLSGATVQHQALLRREMRFSALALIEIVSMLAGIATAVTMAYAGFTYWSLVGMTLGSAAANLAAVWITVRWRPGAPRRGSNVRPMLKFGSDVLSFSVVNYFSRHADNLLIGWYWGAVPLGLYDKAYTLLLWPISQINAPVSAVAIPALSRARPDPARFRRFFLGALQMASSVSVPIVFGIVLFADEIVALWLGPQWHETAKFFRLLSLAALLSALSNPMGPLLIAAGLTRRYRQLGLITAPIIVAAFAIGLPYGPEGVAVSYSTAMALLFLPTWAWAVRGTGVSLRDVGSVLWGPAVAGFAAFLAAAGTRRLAELSMPPAAAALLSAVLFSLVYAFVLLYAFGKWRFFVGLLEDLMPGTALPFSGRSRPRGGAPALDAPTTPVVR